LIERYRHSQRFYHDFPLVGDLRDRAFEYLEF